MFCSAPRISPAAQAIGNEVKSANSAAARAGTTASGSTWESSVVIGAASTPMEPAITAASSVLAIDSRFTDRPISVADVSFSNAAFVSSPKRLQRYAAQSRTVTPIAIPAKMRFDSGTVNPRTVTSALEMIEGSVFGNGPKAKSIAACAARRIPTDATSLTTGEAFLNGRKANTSMAVPSTSDTSRASRNDGTVPSPGPMSPVLNAQNAYPETIATAPTARLMMPEPR